MKEIFLLQKAVRTSTRIPFLSRIAWKVAPAIRGYFGKHFNGERILTEYDEEIKIWVSLSNYIESNIFWQGVEEEDRGQVKLLKKLLKPEHVFFDVGANIGVITMIAAQRLTEGQVHAFEPYEDHLEKLNLNIRVNDFKNVVINPFALGNGDAGDELYIPEKQFNHLTNTGMASIYHENGNEQEDERDYQKEEIDMMKLDDYVEEHDINILDFLKIDVEGGELRVCRGGRRTIDRFRPEVMMEVNRNHLEKAGETPENVITFWDEQNYNIYRIGYEGQLCPIHSAEEFDRHQNIYCCPKEYA